MSEISIGITNALLFGASRLGVNVAEVIDAVGLDRERLADPEGRIGFDEQMGVWAEAARRSGDRDFGLHIAESVPVEMLGVLAHLTMACATLGEALDRYVDYSRLVDASSELQLEEDAGFAHLALRTTCAPWIVPRHVAEGSIGLLFAILRRMLGPSMVLEEVGFQHAAPPVTDTHRRLFGCRVRFGAKANGLVFHPSLLDRRFETANPALVASHSARADELLERLPAADPFVHRVRRRIYESLASGEVAMPAVARELGISVSSLRRRLAAQGSSFREILGTIRRDLALVYLEDRAWSTAEVAFVLGFADTGAFTRSFQRWTGDTPGAYRRSIFG
jgi:AraC-like DNA-binding protein